MADIFTTAERFSQYTEGHFMPWRLHNGFAIIMVKYIFQRFFFLTDYNIKRMIYSVISCVKLSLKKIIWSILKVVFLLTLCDKYFINTAQYSIQECTEKP